MKTWLTEHGMSKSLDIIEHLNNWEELPTSYVKNKVDTNTTQKLQVSAYS